MQELAREGMTSIVVTHEMGFARRAADRRRVHGRRADRVHRPRRVILQRPEAGPDRTLPGAHAEVSGTDGTVSLLARLVAIDSQNPPGNERACADLVAAELTTAGCHVACDTYAPDRVNVVGRIENGPGPVFCFNTHMDVVPAGAGWHADPLVLRAEGGKLIGRGACDCKGPLAAMIGAIRLLAAARETWSGTLLGVFVADEEVASAGAKHFLAQRPTIDYVVVGEPSGNQPIVAHKGSLRPLVRVAGRMAHSSAPDLGVNAIFQAGRLLPRIAALHRTLAGRPHALVGAPSLTVTRAVAGIADNIVPNGCDLLLDRRMVPGETEAAALAEIKRLLEAAAAEGIEARVIECRPTTGGPAETPVDHPVVRAALAAAGAHGVAAPAPQGFSGACDFVHFRTLGAQGVVLGPGRPGGGAQAGGVRPASRAGKQRADLPRHRPRDAHARARCLRDVHVALRRVAAALRGRHR